MKKTTKTKKSKRLSRNEWLDLALNTLAKEGKAKLRIDSLVQSLGVTKGSFYWHFKNRDDFIRSVVQYWGQHFTEQVVEEINRVQGDAKERLLALMQLLSRESYARFDIAVRAWAAHEPQVASLVKEVDERRLAYVGSLFAEMGFSGRELEMRTRTFVCFQSMEFGILSREKKKERSELLKLRHKFFTRP